MAESYQGCSLPRPGGQPRDCSRISLPAPSGCSIPLTFRVSVPYWRSPTQTPASQRKQFPGKNIFLANLWLVRSRIFVGPDPGSISQPSVRLPNRFSRPSRCTDLKRQVGSTRRNALRPRRGGTGHGVSHLLSPRDACCFSLKSDHRQGLCVFCRKLKLSCKTYPIVFSSTLSACPTPTTWLYLGACFRRSTVSPAARPGRFLWRATLAPPRAHTRGQAPRRRDFSTAASPSQASWFSYCSTDPTAEVMTSVSAFVNRRACGRPCPLPAHVRALQGPFTPGSEVRSQT